ncbi:MAG: lipoate--protein ligase family protein [Deltaproteobacteria bacterium]|nr:lipoate--protein ligase family protein [Deltaproteobacteria bacterium]
MQCIDLTLPTPEANLACDEALLDECEAGADREVLRFWESPRPFVVLGMASRREREVHLAACEARGIPVLRRCTGGGTVVQGPGCLSYTLVLRIAGNALLERIDSTNAFVMERHRRALAGATGLPIRRQGTTDLAVGQRKFSGNAQRRRRRCLLFHGTFLLDFPIPLVEELLPYPPKAPAYRGRRAHGAFLANLSLPAADVKDLLRRSWGATDGGGVSAEAIASLVARKYSARSWNERC